ncbi:MAG: tyrosine--tRNA ligase, partial [Limisphaerales bacterium]
LPLITNADGTKFGKTEAGAVWLDPNKTIEKDFFQFWIRTDDNDVERYLKFFTFLPEGEIKEIIKAHEGCPEQRIAQQELAKAITTLIHGPEVAKREAEAIDAYKGKITGTKLIELLPTKEFSKENLTGNGTSLVDLLVYAGMASSKSQARQLISEKGIEVNNERIMDINRRITIADIRYEKFVQIQKGKKTHMLILPV